MERFKSRNVQFKLTWRPFLLDPTLPKLGVNKMEHYKKKFGAERTEKMIPAMIANGLKDGIRFSYGGVISNSIDAHRVVELARKLKGQEAHENVMNELFSNYFEQEKDINDTNVLFHAFKKGIPEADDVTFALFLNRPTSRPATPEEVAKSREWAVSSEEILTLVSKFARKYHIQGVPHMVFGTDDHDVEQVSGAQNVEEFVEAIEAVLGEY